MALPGSKPAHVQLIERKGNRFLAHLPTQQHPVDIGDPSVHVHLGHTGVMYDHGDGSPPVNLHKMVHHNPKGLPPGLLKIIEAALQAYEETRGLHERGGIPGTPPATPPRVVSQRVLPPGAGMAGPPPSPLGGLPGSPLGRAA